ncbi:hypothetical protein M501DRAFT_942724 [Patellaria atrata CBS 101060]|uniref:Uncharacterized protein n=1 Tax=Patellaria atrata CBS 101060 TaxID=1346257 RepID=A0A9P4VMZ7_9PEZI|nr:hypothetical protein M501DRAFT_942724 [Patellaria atrata CBS 101060]
MATLVPAVEAKSLSSLTTLASNPPQYPRNPTHVSHEPLVLYIARVPGSRDVFLTPMKPRERVVTAEDVQSSLYFLHINQPEDQLLVEHPAQSSSNHIQDVRSQLPIPRKALPTRPLSAPTGRLVPSGTGLPMTTDGQNHISERNPNLNTGTRAFGHQRDQTEFSSDNGSKPFSRSKEVRNTSQLNRSVDSGTTITLIRRDPSSGMQWNVGRIYDPSVFEVSSQILDTKNSGRHPKQAGTPIYIDIMNAGYNKFINGVNIMPKLDSRNSTSSIRTLQEIEDSIKSMHVSDFEPKNGVFHRRMWLEGSKFSNFAAGHRRSESGGSTTHPETYSNNSDYRISEDASPTTQGFGRLPLPRDEELHGIGPAIERRSPTSKGYTFLSPWNGRCEFVTGGAGRSLKCKHSLPTIAAASNSSATVTVSELRFNLPTSSRVPSATAPEDRSSARRSSMFKKPQPQIHAASSALADRPDKLDLSLGLEFAGGGFAGRQAKLGKLIIEDEGLKMLDLMVATNMALWWRAYERVDRSTHSRSGSF